jgi:YebC/PmpR family DNA-binding regulatory protein
MSGHSKWASIKHKKGAADAKRGNLFTKIIKEISIAARLGGGDPAGNPRLRTAMLKARMANMPKDNVDRAIKKGTGELEGMTYSELTYEAYGPGRVAILIDVLTDNKNRTAAELRYILSRGAGSLEEAGSVARLFKRKGIIAYSAADYKEDDILAVAVEAGAEDVSTVGDSIEVLTQPEDFEKVLEALEKAGLKQQTAEVMRIAEVEKSLPPDKTRQALKLIENLEEHEDVQSVASNLEIPEGFSLEE